MSEFTLERFGHATIKHLVKASRKRSKFFGGGECFCFFDGFPICARLMVRVTATNLASPMQSAISHSPIHQTKIFGCST